MVASFVYVLACRLFELVVLLARGERSKELGLVEPHPGRSVGGGLDENPQLNASAALAFKIHCGDRLPD